MVRGIRKGFGLCKENARRKFSSKSCGARLAPLPMCRLRTIDGSMLSLPKQIESLNYRVWKFFIGGSIAQLHQVREALL